MHEAQKETQRALAAAKAIVDGRDLTADQAAILVTTEHAVTIVLLAIYRDSSMAAAMLNEGLLLGIEARLARHAAADKR